MDVPTYPSFEVLTSSEARERTPGLKVDPEKLALREERELVRTFKERLDFNAGVTCLMILLRRHVFVLMWRTDIQKDLMIMFLR